MVGGNTLSRGLTLEGLTTSYFVRNSKAYDTLLQMGRWFGYRKGYVDLTRIFVPHELYCNFYELATIEQEIRDEISLMAANEERPIDVAVRIRKIPNMIVTSSNKSRSTKTTYMSYSGTKVQTHQIIAADDGVVKRNSVAVERLIKCVRQESVPIKPKFTDLEKCVLYQDVPVELIMQFLDEYCVASSNSKFVPKLLQDYISKKTGKGELKRWSISIMSLKTGEPISMAGIEIIPVNRNVKHEAIGEGDLVESTLRAVSTPGEELIDLYDEIGGTPKSTDEILLPSDGPRISDVKARYQFRPKDSGLLMIYPLNSNIDIPDSHFEKLKRETKPSFPLRSNGQVFAVSIVFPFSERKSGPRLYIQNKTV